ncbi:MAG: hypothetical protein JXB04_13035 [Kiritimatiellae bacterium]|nr:hypothetical protein [Kiritimatiellia bacterium]
MSGVFTSRCASRAETTLRGVVAACAVAALVVPGRVQGDTGNEPSAAPLIIDRMEPLRGHDTGSLSTPLCKPPSRLVAVREKCGYDQHGRVESGLRLTAHLAPSPENPRTEPGWCAYCITTRKGEVYLDAASHKFLSFYVRGEAGGEKLQVALIDQLRENNPEEAVNVLLEQCLDAGAITTAWQRTRIPLHMFRANLGTVYQVRFIFDNSSYENMTARRLTVYVDELTLE